VDEKDDASIHQKLVRGHQPRTKGQHSTVYEQTNSLCYISCVHDRVESVVFVWYMPICLQCCWCCS